MVFKISKWIFFKFLRISLFYRTETIIYNFNYTIFSTIPSNIIIQQPTAAQYAAQCGAIGSSSNPVDPYIMDICGYFRSINDGNVQLLMQAVSSYYTSHRISSFSSRMFRIKQCSLFIYLFFHRNLCRNSIKCWILCHNSWRCNDSNKFYNNQRFIDCFGIEYWTISIDHWYSQFNQLSNLPTMCTIYIIKYSFTVKIMYPIESNFIMDESNCQCSFSCNG
jgi:hypothetical protein